MATIQSNGRIGKLQQFLLNNKQSLDKIQGIEIDKSGLVKKGTDTVDDILGSKTTKDVQSILVAAGVDVNSPYDTNAQTKLSEFLANNGLDRAQAQQFATDVGIVLNDEELGPYYRGLAKKVDVKVSPVEETAETVPDPESTEPTESPQPSNPENGNFGDSARTMKTGDHIDLVNTTPGEVDPNVVSEIKLFMIENEGHLGAIPGVESFYQKHGDDVSDIPNLEMADALKAIILAPQDEHDISPELRQTDISGLRETLLQHYLVTGCACDENDVNRFIENVRSLPVDQNGEIVLPVAETDKTPDVESVDGGMIVGDDVFIAEVGAGIPTMALNPDTKVDGQGNFLGDTAEYGALFAAHKPQNKPQPSEDQTESCLCASSHTDPAQELLMAGVFSKTSGVLTEQFVHAGKLVNPPVASNEASEARQLFASGVFSRTPGTLTGQFQRADNHAGPVALENIRSGYTTYTHADVERIMEKGEPADKAEQKVLDIYESRLGDYYALKEQLIAANEKYHSYRYDMLDFEEQTRDIAGKIDAVRELYADFPVSFGASVHGIIQPLTLSLNQIRDQNSEEVRIAGLEAFNKKMTTLTGNVSVDAGIGKYNTLLGKYKDALAQLYGKEELPGDHFLEHFRDHDATQWTNGTLAQAQRDLGEEIKGMQTLATSLKHAVDSDFAVVLNEHEFSAPENALAGGPAASIEKIS